ncbi:MAG: hypothetical protein SGI74_12620 [Oligoflexia bacterium]|nr:hypothetical protein [Oligoflexia bacterium]
MNNNELKVGIFRKLLVEAHKLINRSDSLANLVLGILDDGQMTVSQIARVLKSNRQNVQRIANELVADGVCEYTDNYFHSRSKILRLTSKGRKIWKTETLSFAKFAMSYTSPVRVEDLANIMRSLEFMNNSWR